MGDALGSVKALKLFQFCPLVSKRRVGTKVAFQRNGAKRLKAQPLRDRLLVASAKARQSEYPSNLLGVTEGIYARFQYAAVSPHRVSGPTER